MTDPRKALEADPDAGLTFEQIADEIAQLAKVGRGISGTIEAALRRAFERGQRQSLAPDNAVDVDELSKQVDQHLFGVWLEKKAKNEHRQYLDGCNSQLIKEIIDYLASRNLLGSGKSKGEPGCDEQTMRRYDMEAEREIRAELDREQADLPKDE